MLAALGLIGGAVVGYALGAIIFGLIGKSIKAQDPGNPLDHLAMLSIFFWLLCAVIGAVFGAAWRIASYSEHRRNMGGP